MLRFRSLDTRDTSPIASCRMYSIMDSSDATPPERILDSVLALVARSHPTPDTEANIPQPLLS